MDKFILIATDGSNIDHTVYPTLEEAQAKMREAYAESLPDVWEDDIFKNDSCCGETDAVLYDNGENVFVWKIISISEPQETPKDKCTAHVEFCYVKDLTFDYDEDTDDPDKIVMSMLTQESSLLHSDYEQADFVNVAYRYPDGYESEWSQIK